MTASISDLPQRIAEKLVINSDGCWIWTGAQGRKGYGSMHFQGRTNATHRVVYTLLVGDIPAGMHVDHLCFSHGCANPAHLRLTTPKQNNEHREGAQANNTTGYRNVVLHSPSGRWRVMVQHAGKRYHGGYFSEINDANQAAVALRRRLFTHDDGRHI